MGLPLVQLTKLMKKVLQIVKSVAYVVVVSLLVVTAVIFISSAFDLPGGVKLFTVQSGSMSPTIPMGSVVGVKSVDDYSAGDIITFMSEERDENRVYQTTTTHRIVRVVEEDGVEFVTKGDANDAEDPFAVEKELVVGKVAFWIPLLGFPISFTRTREGMFLLIIVPALVIIMMEIWNIVKEVRKLLAKSEQKDESNT